MSAARVENDCLALLAYVAAHRGEAQTFRGLSGATGIPLSTLHRLLSWHMEHGEEHSLLFRAAAKYGYDVVVFRRRPRGRPGVDAGPGRILDVVDRGVPQEDRWGADYDRRGAAREEQALQN